MSGSVVGALIGLLAHAVAADEASRLSGTYGAPGTGGVAIG